MTLSIRILGPLVIESDDCQLGTFSKKGRAPLSYLAAQEGRSTSRERLADLLWPCQTSNQARNSLRSCLWQLRKALGAGATHCLAAGADTCRIEDVAVDLDSFDRLAASQRMFDLQRAADLYRGELLADLDIVSEPFREWLAAERDRMVTLCCDCLRRLISKQAAAGDHDAVIRSARSLVALDPLSEFGQRMLMRAYARAGRRAEALRQFKRCAEILSRELGVAPDAPTLALANRIAQAQAAPHSLLPPVMPICTCRSEKNFRAIAQ
jgi:DNA-binding SARP family transcriptional activator